MAAKDFVHLHVHTDYSMLDGAAKISKLVAEAKRLGQKAVAITDHGYLFGAYEFYRTCKDAGVKPIIGLEAYVTPGTSRFDMNRVLWGTPEQQARGDDVSARGSYTHMTLLARNTTGMHNLFRMGSFASLEGQMGKYPRIDRQLLSTYASGLIGTTGCPSGEVQTRLRLGQWEEARRAAGELQDIFGKENYYVELMDHGLEIERRVVNDLIRLSKEIGAPLLATNDSHYVTAEDARVQDALLCINSGANLSDPNRFKFDGSDYFLRSAQDMRSSFEQFPHACDNTLLIAEQCEVSFVTTADGASYMPIFPVPSGEDDNSWFVKEVERGLHYRYPNGIPDKVRKQAEYEISVILQMGFAGYFLVVADYIQWAKNQGIRVGPGRGSGAGSMVAYVMRITDLDPLEHGLIFERFLNPERVSMPDFDVDFDDRRRGEVIDYVTQKYGADKVAQVVTYGTIKAKQALKDSAKIQGYPFSMGEKLTKAMPPTVMGKDIPVWGIFDKNHPRYAEAEEFRKLYNEEPDTQRIVELAKGIEGLTRQWGVHACAVIMSSQTLTDVIPMMKRPQDGAVITQFDYPTCETLGLLKMDFLGLKNLTIISDALENIKQNGRIPPDFDNLDLSDKKTYELLSSGETLGVFQLDGAGMRSLLKTLRPTEFEDISALVALYRPGPMGADSHTNYALRKNGKQKIKPIHPELEEPLSDILNYTYGLIIYQEQVMAIAQKVAGFTLGQADLLRRAMGKKKKAELDKQFANFEDGMKERGYSSDAINTLWDILVPFSDYAFNKSHSAAYGLISYWTAYLKANYPTEYMAALLTTTKDDKDKLGMYLGEVRHQGITVMPPDVNASAANFTPVGGDIRFGLAAIRNVGQNVVEGIIHAREEKGPFTSFQDFIDKVPAHVCNKRTIESLIKAGGFDSFEHSRRALVTIHKEAVEAAVSLKRQEATGQFDLFAALEEPVTGGFSVDVPNLPEWDKKTKLDFEREMLGLYVSDHPLSGMDHALKRLADDSIASLLSDDSKPNNSFVKIAGLVTSLERKISAKGSSWAIAHVEDLTGSIDVMFFPATYQTVSTRLEENTIITVVGRLNTQRDSTEIFAQSMTIPEISVQAQSTVLDKLEIRMPQDQCSAELLMALRDVLVANPGKVPVSLRLWSGNFSSVLKLGQDLSVNGQEILCQALRELLGNDCIAS